MKILYEDNHLIIVSKRAGDIVQGDKTGDVPLSEALKAFIKERDAKPGNVFLGVAHRLDRPVAGLVVFAKTSKALARLNQMFRDGSVHKTYWAVVEGRPAKPEATLVHHLWRNEQQNKSYVCPPARAGAKEARLCYRTLACGDRYTLLEVQLLTGRHHQIRCQLAAIGCPIKGDLKYGARRSNADGSIALLARHISLTHPVSHQPIDATAPLPEDNLWQALAAQAAEAPCPNPHNI